MEKIKEWIAKLPKKVFAITGAVIVAILIVIIVVANLPGNVSKRAINKGNKLYSEERFEEAAAKYDKAILKNKLNIAGYAGSVMSKASFDKAEARETLLSLVDITTDILEVKDLDINDVIEVYLMAPEVIDDDETLNEVLKYGYETISESSELKPALFDSYVALGDDRKNTDVKEALSLYEEAVALGIESDEVNKKIAECALSLINSLKEGDEYEKALETLDKYGEKYDLDVETLTTEIKISQDLYETKISLLTKVYDAMNEYYELVGKDFSEDDIKNSENVLRGLLSVGWVDMMELDGSEEAEKLAKSQASTAYVYAPSYNSSYTGIGCGLYTYGDVVTTEEGEVSVKYYFYFGEYKNGIRSGYGFTWAQASEDSYRGFEGKWENDAPEGFGVEYTSNFLSKITDNQYQRVTYGNFTKGVENGTMTTCIRLTDASEEMFIGTYEATDGDAPEVPTITENYELLSEVPENQKVIAVIPSVDKGYDIHNVIYQKNGNKLAAIGFN